MFPDDQGVPSATVTAKSNFRGSEVMKEGVGLPGQMCGQDEAVCLFSDKLVIDGVPLNTQTGPSRPFPFISQSCRVICSTDSANRICWVSDGGEKSTWQKFVEDVNHRDKQESVEKKVDIFLSYHYKFVDW